MGFKEEKFKKDIGNLFKEARDKAGLTQAEVAKKAGIDANYYARVERAGKTGPMARGNVLNDIAKALEIKLKFPIGE